MKNLPEGWNKVDISSVVWFQEGPGVRNTQFTNEGVKLLNVRNIVEGKLNLDNTTIHISNNEAYGKYNHFLVDENDLIIASSGITVEKLEKKVAFVKKEHLPLCMNTSTIRFKPIDDSIIDMKYFSFFLKSNYFKHQVRLHITGSAQLNFGPSHLNKMKTILPPLEVQKQIAEILDKADELRQKKKQASEKLDDFLKSTFLNMFGDPVTNPMGWDQLKFGEVGTLARGKSKHRPRNAPELLGGDYPLIQTGDVSNAGIFIKNYYQTYSELGLKQSKMWKNGTLCITIAANIAETGVLNFDACFPDSVVGFHSNEKSNVHYVQFWLMFLQKILEANAPQSAQKNINLAILNDLNIPTPPIELQNKFAQIVEQVEAQQTKNEIATQKLNDLFNSLLKKTFKGELEFSKELVI